MVGYQLCLLSWVVIPDKGMAHRLETGLGEYTTRILMIGFLLMIILLRMLGIDWTSSLMFG